MSKVLVSTGMTLDGYIAPDERDMNTLRTPGDKDWMSRWVELQGWVFQQQFFRQNLALGD